MSFQNAAIAERGTCVALGNFDGIHLGHRAILENCAKTAREESLVSVVWSFRCHPKHILKGDFSTGNIISLSDKEELIREIGIDFLLLEDFERVRDFSPERFCREILLEQLCARKVFCGFNFHFGKEGKGDARFLQEYLAPFGVEVIVEPPIVLWGETISSTRIRAALCCGNMQEVASLLGRAYSIRFPVLHGKRLGTKIGFPTLNQRFPEEYVIPKKGVYIVRVCFDGEERKGICNIGVRPTVSDGEHVTAETHLFDFCGDLYGKKVSVEFYRFLRPEMKFSSLQALAQQIERDRQEALLFWEERK